MSEDCTTPPNIVGIEDWFSMFLHLVTRNLDDTSNIPERILVWPLSVVANALYNNPDLTIKSLSQHGQLLKTFSLFYDQSQIVLDRFMKFPLLKKVFVFGMCSLLSIVQENTPKEITWYQRYVSTILFHCITKNVVFHRAQWFVAVFVAVVGSPQGRAV